VPDERVALGQADAGLGAVLVEQAELDPLATSENRAKLVPEPSYVAPSG
jgi:hypothetical protein